jgi:Uma2 family endonuclease
MSEMVLPYVRHRIRVEEYRRMAEAFPSGARIELIDGDLIETVVPMNPPHASRVQKLTMALVGQLAGRAQIRCQLPVTLDDYSEPEPDCAVVRFDARDYFDDHPRVPDIFLLIEVADSSRDADRRMKVPLYGRCGVSETWLVDLVDDLVIVYRDPGDDGYGLVAPIRRGEVITPLAFPDCSVAVDAMLPPR